MAKEKKKIKVGTIVLIIVIALVAAVVIMAVSSAKMMSQMTSADISQLEKKDISNTVSVSGLVESCNFKSVASNLSYNVETVNVEVGDKVKKGDILCTLNTDDLQDQILQQQASIDNSSINTEYSISDAEKSYNDALAAYNDGTNTAVRNAKTLLDNAEAALQKAQDKYDEQSEIAGSDRDSQLVAAKSNVDSAAKELEYAKADYDEAKSDYENEDYSDLKDLKKAYEDAKKEYDSRYSVSRNKALSDAREAYESALENYSTLSALKNYGSSDVSEADLEKAKNAVDSAHEKLSELEAKGDAQSIADTYEKALDSYTKALADLNAANEAKLRSAERAYERAENSYNSAVKNLELVESGNEMSLKEYKSAVDDARTSVDEAKESYNLAVKEAETSLAKLKAEAERQKMVSENDPSVIALDILMKKLDEAVITAPCDGTVTSVNVVEGSAAVGTLFIIEDTDNLKMTAAVKEYSIGELKEGTEVTVTASALDGKEFDGVISKIAPTAVKGADGKSDGTSSFNIEVTIRDTKDSGLLIGMTAKMTAVTGSAEDVFAVGYDAVVEDSDGASCIYTYEETSSGTGIARKLSVETGFESDAEIEIISDSLTEGMSIITNAGDMTDGGIVMASNIMADQAAEEE
jgi:RND family efflux transporter MFP subunit